MDDDIADARTQGRDRHLLAALISAAQAEKAEYSQDADRPLGSYAVLTAGYAALAALAGSAARRRGLRPQMPLADTVLATVATAKLARTLAKDPITSFLRAPFTRFAGLAGEAELAEEVRGRGPRHAIGELLTCPFCLGPWFAGAFVAGYTFTPTAARSAALIGTMTAGADVFQYSFAVLQEAWSRFSEDDDS